MRCGPGGETVPVDLTSYPESMITDSPNIFVPLAKDGTAHDSDAARDDAMPRKPC